MNFYFSALLFVSSLAFSFTSCAQSKSLFNGKDLTGWHIDVPAMDKNATVKSPFLVRD
jgi:hypothetical protein